ncbi:gluconate 2-dehydrogenase subunit 3 family protein [Hwangdonia lutea]|uniref:Gluconate 2-dehydrogenase subunit 3 family protein n=1 Tax=Hwangdonia lutea TaxID=3075823 RepID=A0AA97EPE4_9FLAO|nr:gluconate 2-dehydrogenase subunit 3 family protein [Hwangdonia sp. SCSIO 19198]WOD45119.1 gluconate 2-dehydrogenase subunit 3 family protein [Hwangdonia sp. SCSIO 19198]
MDRRKAIKNIALAFGCTVATPTLLNVVTACTDNSVSTNYLFLSKSEAELVERLTETIMPKMYFPLVETMNLTVFLDQMFYHTENDKSKENFRKGSKAFENELSLNHNKKVNKISNEDFIATFKTYFNPEKEDAVFNLLNDDFNELSPDKKTDFSMYTFLTKVRNYCLFGYATSEAFSSETNFYTT